MKLVLVSDLHLMGRSPISRTDDFPETQYNKVKQIKDIAKKRMAYFVLQAGDFFDSYNPSYRLINKYIDLLEDSNWYSILGQHDMYMWNKDSIDRTALGVLETAGCLKILRDSYDNKWKDNIDTVKLYGCSWGQEIPKIDADRKINILVIHKNIGDKPLFHGHDLTHPRRFLNKHKFDLILCGDYHFPFEYSSGDRLIINTGTISRKSTTEKVIKPSVVLYDTETRKHEWVVLKHEPDPFISKTSEEKVSGSIDMTDFFSEITSAESAKISFRDNVMKVLNEKTIDEQVKQKAVDILNMEDL
jgi:exonuclease SbcD